MVVSKNHNQNGYMLGIIRKTFYFLRSIFRIFRTSNGKETFAYFYFMLKLTIVGSATFRETTIRSRNSFKDFFSHKKTRTTTTTTKQTNKKEIRVIFRISAILIKVMFSEQFETSSQKGFYPRRVNIF